MTQMIQDVMTKRVTTLDRGTTLVDAAQAMDRRAIGDVLVSDGGGGALCGILTDRDIVVRGLAKGCDPKTTTVGEICTSEMVTVEPTASLEEAKKMMADHAVRRLPVVENGAAIGIVSLGDIAVEDSGERPLEEISAAPANN